MAGSFSVIADHAFEWLSRQHRCPTSSVEWSVAALVPIQNPSAHESEIMGAG
jgi:hypothetical protein